VLFSPPLPFPIQETGGEGAEVPDGERARVPVEHEELE